MKIFEKVVLPLVVVAVLVTVFSGKCKQGQSNEDKEVVTETQDPTPVTPEPPKPPPARRYTGYVTSQDVDAKSFSVNTLSVNEDGSYRLRGSVDNVNLIGKWDLTGYETIKDNKKTFVFMGDLDFGGIQNYPPGATAPIIMYMDISEDGITGRYEVAASKYGPKEHGLIELH